MIPVRRFARLFCVLCGIAFMPVGAYGANNCTGATYYDAENDICVACPAGYDYNTDAGKTSITQCQAQCPAGTYIPPEYTQLEYIASTGNQWINTNISGFNSANNEIYVKFMRTSAPTRDYETVFRIYTNEDTNTYRVISSVRSVPTRYVISTNTKATGGNIGAILENNVTHEIVVRNNSANINGTEYEGAGITGIALASSANLKIMGDYAPFIGRIYNLYVRRNGSIIANFVPARRNSDNKLGMYDTVNNVFYTNAGSGSFGAGPASVCVSVGYGYYAPASVTNYGFVGTRNACPAGTYSNITNATNINDCISCTGATYSGPAAGQCATCPAGYDYNTTNGKTSINQCQIYCNRGTYASEYTQLEYLQSYGQQIITTNQDGFNSNGWNIHVKWMLTSASYNNYYAYIAGVYQSESHNAYRIITNKGSITQYYVNGNSLAGGSNLLSNITASAIHEGTIVNGSVTIDGTTYNTMTKGTNLPAENKLFLFRYFVGRIYELSASDNGVLKINLIPVRRNSDGTLGMYDTVNDVFYTNSGTGSFGAGPEQTDAVLLPHCVNVGNGYWSTASITNFGSSGVRNACPAGTTTVGYGRGADEANDCGPILHVGEHVIYTRANRITNPSLNFKMPNGNIYYGNVSTTNHNLSGLHLKYNDTTCTVYDDSLFYGEREF